MSTVNYGKVDIDGMRVLRRKAGRVAAPALLLCDGGD
jgi:hypothetical protein